MAGGAAILVGVIWIKDGYVECRLKMEDLILPFTAVSAIKVERESFHVFMT